MISPAKARIIEIVKLWRQRSGLAIEVVLARMQAGGYDISRTVFENRFTTHVEQAPNVPPEMTLALVEAFSQGLLPSERCRAAEALELARLANLPFDWVPKLARFFPAVDFVTAYAPYAPHSAFKELAPPAVNASPFPYSITRFVSREADIAEIRQRLTQTRLLTLTGPGSSGKTCLALEVAARLQGAFRDGVAFISLETLNDSAGAPGRIAQALQIQLEDAEAPVEKLTDHLRARVLLLVIDNCEHLLPSLAWLVTTLVQACPQLHCLATSRETLNVPGEMVLAVPPLLR